MHLKVYSVTDPHDLPSPLFWALDGYDDRFIAAFTNYPSGEKLVVSAWGTTGEAADRPIGGLIATTDRIITGYIDLLFIYGDGDVDDSMDVWDDEEGDEEDAGEAVVVPTHNEPGATRILTAMLARLRRVTKATWLLVHDADEAESWLEQGFVIVDPPADIPADDTVLILAWGELPADVQTLLRVRGLSWLLPAHRRPRHGQAD